MALARWKRVVLGGLLLAGAGATLGCGRADGDACANDDECRSGSACVYTIADLCAATRTCQQLPTGPMCQHELSYCDCDGNLVDVPVCHLPAGSSTVRIGGNALGGPCPSGAAKPVGSPCTDRSQCGVSQVCAFPVADLCAAQGTCQPEPFVRGCPLDDTTMTFCGCGADEGREVIEGCDAPAGTAPEPVSRPRVGNTCSRP